MGREFVKSPEMAGDGIDMICERLSRQPDLYLPHALATRAQPVTQIERKDHLANLLRRDAAVFLGYFSLPPNPSGCFLVKGNFLCFELPG